MCELRNSHEIVNLTPGGKESLGRQIHGWEDNMSADLKEMRCDGRTGEVWLRIGLELRAMSTSE
jgi:hypothetical protein